MELKEAVYRVNIHDESADIQNAARVLLDFARRAADALRCYDNITAPPGYQADLSIIQTEARPLVEEARTAGLLDE
jgi:hypothetical protein